MRGDGKIRLTLSLTLNNRDWDLYDMKGADAVARQLNMEVARAINDSTDRTDAELTCMSILDKFAKFGAADTEPRGVLRRILERVYGGG